jgi:hypothetical protein
VGRAGAGWGAVGSLVAGAVVVGERALVSSLVVTGPIFSSPQVPHLVPGVAFARTSSIFRGVADQRDWDGSISPARTMVEVASRSPALT